MGALALSTVLLLAAPCVNTAPLEEGASAPCSGLLWGVDRSRAAVACARVDLPRCQSELRLRQAQLDAVLSAPPPPPSDPKERKFWWALSAGAVGLVAGVVGGFVLGGAIR